MTLTAPQLLALAMAARGGMLHRLPGGIWTHEPEAWRADLRDAVEDDWARTETVEALARRGLLSARGKSAYVITQRGRDELVRWFRQQQRKSRRAAA